MSNEHISKLTGFNAAILNTARAEAEAMDAEGKEIERRTLADCESALAAESARKISAGTAEIHAGEEKRLVAGRLQSRRRLLEYREDCSKAVMDEVRRRLEAFPKSPAYAGRLSCLLLRAVCAAPGGGGMRVMLRSADMGLREELEKAVPQTKLEFAEGAFTLGGLMLETADGGRRIDLTFDSALADLEGDFSGFTGFSMEEHNGR